MSIASPSYAQLLIEQDVNPPRLCRVVLLRARPYEAAAGHRVRYLVKRVVLGVGMSRGVADTFYSWLARQGWAGLSPHPFKDGRVVVSDPRTVTRTR